MHHEKDLLHDVVEGRGGNTAVRDGAPYEREIGVVHLPKTGPRRFRLARHAEHLGVGEGGTTLGHGSAAPKPHAIVESSTGRPRVGRPGSKLTSRAPARSPSLHRSSTRDSRRLAGGS